MRIDLGASIGDVMLTKEEHHNRRMPEVTLRYWIEHRASRCLIGCRLMRHRLAASQLRYQPAASQPRRRFAASKPRLRLAASQPRHWSCRGQGTVEAAIAIPILFILMLLLLQPAIVLYDRVVMGNAAAEACRLIATSTDALGSMSGSSEAFVRHRLAAIPQHECFHAHEDGCSWDIELSGDESSGVVTVRIANELKPLPLFDAGSTFLGLTNGRGHLVIEESVSMPTQPDWVSSSPEGTDPASWIGAWKS